MRTVRKKLSFRSDGRRNNTIDVRPLHPGLQLTTQRPLNLAPSWNVAPTDEAGVILTNAARQRTHERMRWGLSPFWDKGDKPNARMINARAETVTDKPAFREAFQQRRCLVPAGGFYEWRNEGRLKQPFYMTRADGRPMTFAGLWESKRTAEGELRTFSIITTAANGFMSNLHDRMPVVLEQEAFAPWLDRGGTDLLGPAGEGVLRRHPVSTRVNSVRYNEADCIEAFDAA